MTKVRCRFLISEGLLAKNAQEGSKSVEKSGSLLEAVSRFHDLEIQTFDREPGTAVLRGA